MSQCPRIKAKEMKINDVNDGGTDRGPIISKPIIHLPDDLQGKQIIQLYM